MEKWEDNLQEELAIYFANYYTVTFGRKVWEDLKEL